MRSCGRTSYGLVNRGPELNSLNDVMPADSFVTSGSTVSVHCQDGLILYLGMVSAFSKRHLQNPFIGSGRSHTIPKHTVPIQIKHLGSRFWCYCAWKRLPCYILEDDTNHFYFINGKHSLSINRIDWILGLTKHVGDDKMWSWILITWIT